MRWPLLPFIWALGCTALNEGRCDAEPPAGELHWLSVGDWGLEGEPQQKVVAEMAKHAEGVTSNRFALLLGDNFYPSGVDHWNDKKWTSTYEDVFNPHAALNIPHYAVLGNHDYMQDPMSQVQRTKKVPDSNWKMPSRWYTQEFALGCSSEGDGAGGATALFIFIDTMVLAAGLYWHGIKAEERKEHWEWLQETLKNARATYIFVIGHHPVFSAGWHGDQKDLVNKLEPLLDQYGVDGYFSGHDHDEQMHSVKRGSDRLARAPTDLEATTDSLAYIVTGSGSKLRSWGSRPWHTHVRFRAAYYGFVSSHINASHYTTSFHGDTGELRHVHVQRSRPKRPGTIMPMVVPPGISYGLMKYFQYLIAIFAVGLACCAGCRTVRQKVPASWRMLAVRDENSDLSHAISLQPMSGSAVELQHRGSSQAELS